MTTQIETIKPLTKLRSALATKFPLDKVDEVLDHYKTLRKEARLEHWSPCLVSGGMFVEAVLKCFHFLSTGTVVNSVKADEEIKKLENANHLSDFERLTIPRALRLIYELRNKRGGAHNSSFNPLKMDCYVVVAVANWVMEELTRLYLTNDETAARALVESLLVKDVPLVEEIGEDWLVLNTSLSARVQLEILLYKKYPERCNVRDLIRWLHNQHSQENVRVTLRTMKQKNFAHETVEGWLLTETGLHEAEIEIAKLQSDIADTNTVSRGKLKGAKRGRK